MTSRPRLAKTTDRGYGAEHKRLRKHWTPIVQTGTVECAYPPCGELIQPGTPWDLGHDDDDRTIYTGPEHRGCNRKHRAERAAQRKAHVATTDPEPLDWT